MKYNIIIITHVREVQTLNETIEMSDHISSNTPWKAVRSFATGTMFKKTRTANWTGAT